jgi:hypothetical protein
VSAARDFQSVPIEPADTRAVLLSAAAAGQHVMVGETESPPAATASATISSSNGTRPSRFRHSPSRHSSVASSESAGLDQKYHGRCMRIRPCRQMTRAALCVFVCVPWRCDGGRCCCYLWEPCGAWTAADSHLGLGCHPEGGDPTRAKLWLAAKPASSGEAKGCGREEIQHAGWAQGKGILAAGIANAELRHSA